MQVFGPSSVSSLIYYLTKIVYYISVLFFVVVIAHFVFGLLDYIGLQNPIASMSIDSNDLDLNMKLFTTSIKSDGDDHGTTIILPLIILTLLFYVLISKYMMKLFEVFKSPKLFIPKVTTLVKKLAWTFSLAAFTSFLMLLTSSFSKEGYFYLIVLCIFSLLLGFISEVFKQGINLQQEADLTI